MRPAHRSVAVARSKAMMASSRQPLAPFSRTAMRATSLLKSVTYMERSAANGRPSTRLSKRNLQGVPVPIGARHPHGRRPAALEGKREGARLGIEGDLADLDDRPPLDLDRPDQERGPEGGGRQAGRRQRPQAPVAVLRIEHQHLLPAHRPDHPHLQQVQALLDARADAHGGGGRAPEGGKRQADHPEIDLLVERRALGRLRRAGVGSPGAVQPVQSASKLSR